MAENTDVPGNADENATDVPPAPGLPVPEGPAADDTAVAAAVTEPAPAGPRLRDRMWSFRSMIALGAASLLLGGAGGAALVAATGDDHGRMDRVGRFADGPGGRGDRDGQRGGPGGDGGGPQFGPNRSGAQEGSGEAPPTAP